MRSFGTVIALVATLVVWGPSSPASATAATRDTVDVGDGPSDVALGADGDIWVLNSGSEDVSRIDPDTGAVIDTIEVDPTPFEIATGADGDLWATSFYGDLTRIDPDTGDSHTVVAAEYTGGITVGNDGDLWVTSYPSTVVRVDPVSETVVDTVAVGDMVTGLTTGLDGDIWVTNQGSGDVTWIDGSSGDVIDTIEVGGQPYAATTGADGDIWITDSVSDGQVFRLDGTDGSILTTVDVGGTDPDGATTGSDGHIWVTSRTGSIDRIDPATNQVIDFQYVGTSLLGLATGADGDVWVTDSDADEVIRVGMDVDVAAGLTSTPAVVAAGNPVTLTATVTNLDLYDRARDAAIALTLPSGIGFVSSPDGCTATGAEVTCPPSDLGHAESTTSTIVVSTSTAGEIVVSGALTWSNPGVNSSFATSFIVDGADPIVTLTTPAEGATFTRGQDVNATYSCSDGLEGSGIDTCVGDLGEGSDLDTATLGAHTFTVTATDNAGRTSTVTHHYTVVAPLCAGRAVTVMSALGDTPTGGNDVILGTTAADVLNAGNGNDTVCGLDGNDRINGGAGNDKVLGAGGNDALTGAAGNDTLDGGAGTDTLLGGAGNDTLAGGPQRDTCKGQAGTRDRQTGCEVRTGFP